MPVPRRPPWVVTSKPLGVWVSPTGTRRASIESTNTWLPNRSAISITRAEAVYGPGTGNSFLRDAYMKTWDSAAAERQERHTRHLTDMVGVMERAGDLLQSEHGRLVFVASVASLRGVPYAAHYAASKHGLLGLSRSLAAEYAKTNLTVNAVCPGYVDTPMTDQSIARVAQITGRSADDSRSAITNMNASGRLVDPDGIATMILTLCLPQSRDISGAAITIDGATST